MKYKNKITGEIVVANSYALKYMCENNSNFEKIVEVKSTKVVEEKDNEEKMIPKKKSK